MKRPKSSAKLSPENSASPRRIARDHLRDHATPERVERIWGRLHQHIELTPQTNAQPQRAPQRWWLLAAGVAAGFALGLGSAAMIIEQPQGATPVVVAPTEDDVAARQVFAAGTAPRSYTLPGGGQLQLSPQSIVDTVRQDSGELTLRLVRGQATLRNNAAAGRVAGDQRLALRIGDARVEAIEGQLQVKLNGDTAKLLMLDGTAAVSSPHLNQGRRQTLRQHQQADIPTRVITAVVPLAPVPMDISDGEPSDPTATPGPVVMAEQPDAAPTEWMKACAAFDYAKAAELLGEQGLAQANNAEHLMCIATGHQALQHGSVAINLYQQVIQQYADSHYAFQAAHHLANIYRAAGNSSEHARFAQLARELSKGALLTEPALCQKIQQEGEAQNDDQVLALSKRYREQYPDGPCSDTVEQLLAEANKRKAAAAAAAAAAAQTDAEQDAGQEAGQDGAADGDDKRSGDEDTPYADEEDKESTPSDKP